jgi:hypothetical protein
VNRLGGHLGTRVSALLDGQLSAEDEERAWDHVHLCHLCRDLVEREGWVKTRLAGLTWGSPAEVPSHLRGSLMDAPDLTPELTPGEAYLVGAGRELRIRRAGLVALGSGAAGAAVVGVLVLGGAPADIPGPDRRAPSTSVNTPSAPAGVGTSRRDPTP